MTCGLQVIDIVTQLSGYKSPFLFVEGLMFLRDHNSRMAILAEETLEETRFEECT